MQRYRLSERRPDESARIFFLDVSGVTRQGRYHAGRIHDRNDVPVDDALIATWWTSEQ